MIDNLIKTSDISDADIVRKVLEGNRKMLEVIYERYASKIYYKCLSVTKNSDISKDLSHDIIIKVFTNLDKFQGKSDFSFWVYAITTNHCLTYIKKQSKSRVSELDSSEYEVKDEADQALQNKILGDMQLDQLEQVFVFLDPKDKLLLMMRYQDGLSVKKIAVALKIGESAVKMRLKRSRDKLAELIKDMNNDG